MRVAHVFDGVGDEIARRERVKHAVVPHGDAVVDGDGVKFCGEATLRFDERFHLLPDFVQMRVSGNELRK